MNVSCEYDSHRSVRVLEAQMLRLAIGLLAIPHGVIAFWATTTDLGDAASSGICLTALLADALALAVSIFGSSHRWLVWLAVILNASVTIAFFVVPFFQADPEYVEGLGIMIATGWIIPAVGPMLINAVLLYIM